MKKTVMALLLISTIGNTQSGGDFALNGGFWVTDKVVLAEDIFANGFEN